MMRLVGIIFAISFRNDIVEFVYILIMCHLSYDVMCFCIVYELGDVVNFLFVKKKKKIFLLYFAIHRRNEGVVTYGIRAGSTRDLGFTTDVLTDFDLASRGLLCPFS
jgi:hypothetical protein